MARGRPSKYDEKLHPQLIKWMARSGLTDREIAAEIGIKSRALDRWKKKHPAVMEALQTSRNFVDSLVEDSLLKRALGYEFEETRITARKDKSGQTVERLQKTKVHVAPDVTAQIYWLKNRKRAGRGLDQRLVWQDTYKVEQSLPFERPPDELTDAELDAEIAALEQSLSAEERKEAKTASGKKPTTLH